MNFFIILFSGIIFMAGVLCVIAGVVRINRFQLRAGGFLLLIGLGVAIGAAQSFRQRVFLSDAQRKMLETQQSLAEVREQRERIDRQKSRVEADLRRLSRDLGRQIKPNQNLETQMVEDQALRTQVERAVQMRRWISECERALADLSASEKAMENTIFYMKNLIAMSGIGDERFNGAHAKELEARILEQSQTPTGGQTAIPPGEDELQAIRELIAVP